ncbi:hypothetical protein SESBI_49136 [Sesbania bispinosa]|nr:hypothetical protein SESBI_49136 [Sesbania bispinosa]
MCRTQRQKREGGLNREGESAHSPPEEATTNNHRSPSLPPHRDSQPQIRSREALPRRRSRSKGSLFSMLK